MSSQEIFKPYHSRPITRFAAQITEEDAVVKSASLESTYALYRSDGKNEETAKINRVNFKAYEEPKVGDWIVRLTDEDTYHVTDTIFRDRNIVPLGE